VHEHRNRQEDEDELGRVEEHRSVRTRQRSRAGRRAA
jgi:hypothetical protein